ncbi:MAG: glycerol-3-phosphate dehydrogenase/oxidase [Chloroflexi bacterium]|nr:glycerol-3-phosphate dehydrogenase/oxidase [Chloroflexota bacterium]
MQRNLHALTETIYDVLVIGGGIYGAAVAWEAALRGLSVALIEKGDFCGATSANSLKTIHGGLRYLQHADFKRMRESIRERTTLMRIAPHLVHPLPVLVPTYGHGLKGREVLALALQLNDALSFDRHLPDPQKHLPPGYTISRQECLRRLPGIPDTGLTGGAVFYDAQAYNTERLVIALLHSATTKGAQIANYVEATGFLRQGSAVSGVTARDRLTGDRLDIHAKLVINTTGPWVNRVLGWLGKPQPETRLALSINVITRQLFEGCAVGLPVPRTFHDADTILNKGSRLLFFSPWRGHTITGTTAEPYAGKPDDCLVSEEHIQRFLDDINAAYPPAHLTPNDVTLVHAGLLPASGVDASSGEARIAKHYRIHDHRQDGVDGLLTVIGVKYTTARHVAEETINQVFGRVSQRPPRSPSATTPLYGGSFDRFNDLLRELLRQKPCGLDANALHHLAYNYGSAYPDVLRYYAESTAAARGQHKALLEAETRHAIRSEMAHTLADVLLRRTDYGSAAYPGEETVRTCAGVMAAERGWTPARVRQEIETFKTHYRFGRGIHAAVAGTPV